ncbi:glutathione S-transferase-like [Euwallacea fornicatus]|uniref:glutathione S-transferase-like n=1 Tax=Euwallacea fornicatus TaxID=995702 RepID=UPI00338DE647
MAPKYKLTYFPIAGLAEQIRFLFSYGGIEFEDNRIDPASWPTLKSTTPVGQLPILEVDGKVLFQSIAINRYLGHILGLAGKTPLENCEIDAVADTITDLRFKFTVWHQQEEGPKKEELKEKLSNEVLPLYLGKFEQWATANGGYLALGRLTWVDIVAASIFEVFDKMFASKFQTQSLLNEYPTLQKLQSTVFNIPNIKAWIDKRPADKLQ